MQAFTIRETSDLERVAARFWPTLDERSLGGWRIRFAKGVTRRANSVLALASPGCDVDIAIERAQQMYSARDLPTYFQMTQASLPRSLDTRLAERGYAKEMRVYVEVSELRPISHVESDVRILIEDAPTDMWIDCYTRGGGYSDHQMQVRLDIISRCRESKCMATAFFGDQAVGIGLGVTDGQWLGLFSIITLPGYRRRGVAESVSSNLAAWAQSKGATHAFLQVETDNMPARALYDGMGFEIAYEYWYRLLQTI